MAKGTSISKSVIAAFLGKAAKIKDKYGIDLQLVEIAGGRWSYAAGQIDCRRVNLPPVKLKLSREIGVLIYKKTDSAALPQELRRDLFRIIKT